MKKVALVLLVISAIGLANRKIQLRPGEKTTVGDTIVTCEKKDSTVQSSDEEPKLNCHEFHSENSCRNLPIGSTCKKKDEDKRGRCVQESFFAGKPNCVCQ